MCSEDASDSLLTCSMSDNMAVNNHSDALKSNQTSSKQTVTNPCALEPAYTQCTFYKSASKTTSVTSE